MKKIVIFEDVIKELPSGTVSKNRVVLRSITPNASFCGFTKNGAVIDSEVRKLCSYLEPKFTGYYIS
jgi:hypothetical protein